MSDYQKALDYGCGDHSCFFVKPKGMGTNGGCRCLPTRSTMRWITESFKILAAKDQRINQLESALRDMGEALRIYASEYNWSHAHGEPVFLGCDMETKAYNVAKEAVLRNKKLLEEINKEKEA